MRVTIPFPLAGLNDIIDAERAHRQKGAKLKREQMNAVILVLRRQYDPIQLIQLPVALIFGALTDFSVWAIRGISCTSYPMAWLLCVIGILLVGVGVSFEVTAGVVTLAGEGMVLAVCKAFPVKFASAKVGFDVTLVVLATALSFLFLGQLTGVREGTVAAAICVGLVAKQVNRPMKRFAQRYL